MRIGAEARIGELGHVGFCNDHGSRLAQPRDDGGVRHRRFAARRQHFRSGAGDLALDVEQILDGDDRAVERAARAAGFDPRVGGVGGLAGVIRIDGKAGARTFPGGVGDFHKGLFEAVAG